MPNNNIKIDSASSDIASSWTKHQSEALISLLREHIGSDVLSLIKSQMDKLECVSLADLVNKIQDKQSIVRSSLSDDSAMEDANQLLGAKRGKFNEYLARLGFKSDPVELKQSAVVQIIPKFSVNLYAGGLRTTHQADEYYINSIQLSGGIDMLLGENTDSVLFNSDPYVPMVLGCISTGTPISFCITRSENTKSKNSFAGMLVGTTDRTFLQIGAEGLLPYLVAYCRDLSVPL